MPTSGGQPEEPWEQRIRPAPRSLRPAPPPEELPVLESPSPAPPLSGEPPTPMVRPDRSRMDPLSLDRSTTRKLSRWFRQEKQTGIRSRRARKIDRMLMRGLTILLVVAGTGMAVWKVRSWLKRNASQVFGVAERSHITAPSADRVLNMLEAFLTTADVSAKAVHVLDRTRVQPLMEAAYAKGKLPEAQVRFGVPQPLETGVWAVPAKVLGPPEFLLHLMVREVQGEPKLDWETYEQEMTQRFVSFAAQPGQRSAEFRLVLERAHPFAAGPDESTAVRLAAPGSPALAEPVTVRPDIAPALADALPWDRRRRALVRLEWDSASGSRPRLMLREVVRWEFLPP